MLSVLCHSYNVPLEEMMKISISNVNFYTTVSAIFQKERYKNKVKKFMLYHFFIIYQLEKL